MPANPSTVTVPPDLQKKHPELVALILGSESMNDEERQYWVNILPVMTAEQIENLRQILQNEKDQLIAIDAKYKQEMANIGAEGKAEEMGKKQREKSAMRRAKEEGAAAEEGKHEEAILKAIQNLEDE